MELKQLLDLTDIYTFVNVCQNAQDYDTEALEIIEGKTCDELSSAIRYSNKKVKQVFVQNNKLFIEIERN